jgi:hypothetical protein
LRASARRSVATQIGDRHDHVRWVIPIHPLERRSYLAHDLEAREQLFAERGLAYLDPTPPPVVAPDEV